MKETGPNDETGANETLVQFGTRLSWGLVCPLVLFFVAAYILRDGHAPLSLPSLFYFGVLFFTVVLRLFDVEVLHGTTLGGRPATFEHWKAYALFTVFTATLLWMAVQTIVWSEHRLGDFPKPPPAPAW